MELIKVESSNIDSIGYKNSSLFIKFKKGTLYEFQKVPEVLYNNLLKSDSKGKYFNKEIKGNYQFNKL